MTPAGLGRSSRRLTRASMFVFDAAAHVKARLRPLADSAPSSLRRQGYLAFMAENMCAMHGIEVQLGGRVPRTPAILVANHISYLDPLVIMSAVPTLAIAKHEVARWPVLGELCRGLDMLLVDRSSPHSGARVLLRARTLLERGASILVFPEGTTTRGDDVLPFKRGVFGLARRLGLPVVPIALDYLDEDVAWVDDMLLLPHYFKTSGQPRVGARLEFGAPMFAEPSERAEQFAARVRDRLCSQLRRDHAHAA
ncbi:lysophospholipid acyltransferase family protein [Nannocystaceae bacterium ST9]